jgi:hypothetical protein
MVDTLRHGFRPPSEAEKATDADYVAAGGELAVAAMLMSQQRQKGLHWLPQGRLLVTRQMVTWKGSRQTRFAEIGFARGEWTVRVTPRTQWSRSKSVLVSFVNNNDRTIHHDFRIPTPDVDLVESALTDIG